MTDPLIVTILLLLLTSGLPVLCRQSLQSVRRARLQGARHHGVLRALEQCDRYCTAADFWTTTFRSIAAVLTGLSAETFSAALILLMLTAFGISSIIPRIIARRAPEKTAAAMLPLFTVFTLPLRPVYYLAGIICKRLKSVFPVRAEQTGMTEDELRYALIEGEKSGIVASKERTMVEGVFYLGDRPLGTFMTHRSELQWLDIHAPPQEIRAKVLEYRIQRCFPVADGALDAIIGAAYLEDIVLDCASKTPAGLRAIMKKALFAPETMPALKAFESFKKGKADFLFVMDEYGGFAGMVCAHDLMEEIVGELAAPIREEEQAVQQEDGSWLAGGGLNIDDAAALFALPDLAIPGDYHTLAGFVLSIAGELPRTGDSFVYEGYRFTVLEMDGNRIDKIGVRQLTAAGT